MRLLVTKKQRQALKTHTKKNPTEIEKCNRHTSTFTGKILLGSIWARLRTAAAGDHRKLLWVALLFKLKWSVIKVMLFDQGSHLGRFFWNQCIRWIRRIEKENCRNKLACLGQMRSNENSDGETGKERCERRCESTLLKAYRAGKSIHVACHSPL